MLAIAALGLSKALVIGAYTVFTTVLVLSFGSWADARRSARGGG
jgi:hypothetical protein